MAEHVVKPDAPPRASGGPRMIADADGGTMASDPEPDARYLGRPSAEEASIAPAGAAPAALSGRPMTFRDYFPNLRRGGREAPDLPPPLTQLWYRHPFDGQWVEAVVRDTDAERVEAPSGYGAIHLVVNTSSYHARTSPEGDPNGVPLCHDDIGFAFNVVEGTDEGQWQREKPEGADETYTAEQARHLYDVARNRETAREGGLQATHRGPLPRNVR
jgi:hypothetical protein